MREIRIAVVGIAPREREAVAAAFDAAPPNWRIALCDEAPPEADLVVSTSQPADVVIAPGGYEDVVPRIAGFLTRPAEGSVISVLGATGGCGATTLALHLTQALARRGPAVYLESDPFSRTAAFRLGMNDNARDWSSAGDDNALETAALPVEGIRVLLAPPAGTVPAGLPDRAAAACGTVVCDRALSPSASAGILVTPPTPAGARRTAAMTPDLPDIPWAVVVNHTAPGDGLPEAAFAEITGVAPTVSLPFTPLLRNAELRCRLLRAPWTRYHRRVARLADALRTTR